MAKASNWSWRAILMGLGTYAIYVLVRSLFHDNVVSLGGGGLWRAGVEMVFGALGFLLAGYVAGRFAGERGFTHGLVAGVLIAVMTVAWLFFEMERSLVSPVSLLLTSVNAVWPVVLACAGGRLGQRYGTTRMRA